MQYTPEKMLVRGSGDKVAMVRILKVIPLLSTDLLFCVHKAIDNDRVLVVSEFTTGLKVYSDEVNMKTLLLRAQGILYEHGVEELKEKISSNLRLNSLPCTHCLQRIK